MEVKTEEIETPSHRQVVRRKRGGERHRKATKSSSAISSVQTMPKWTRPRLHAENTVWTSTCLDATLAKRHLWLRPSNCSCHSKAAMRTQGKRQGKADEDAGAAALGVTKTAADAALAFI